jgi:hypothetical protein
MSDFPSVNFVKQPIDKSKELRKVAQFNRDDFGFVSFFDPQILEMRVQSKKIGFVLRIL